MLERLMLAATVSALVVLGAAITVAAAVAGTADFVRKQVQGGGWTVADVNGKVPDA